MSEVVQSIGIVPDFQWYRYRGDRSNGYILQKGKIVPNAGASAVEYAPLKDPDLLFSFARLANQGKPSEKKVMKWINRYGLLHLQEDAIWDKAKDDISPNVGNPYQKPIYIEDVSREAKQVASLLNLYADILHRDYDEFASRMEVVAERQKDWSSIIRIPQWVEVDPWEYKVKSGTAFASERDQDLDNWLLEASGLADRGKVNHSFFDDDFPFPLGASYIFDVFMTWKLAPVRVKLHSTPISGGFKSKSSLDCQDLCTAIYVQLTELVTSGRPVKRCERKECRMPFTYKRERRKKYCNSTCRSSAR